MPGLHTEILRRGLAAGIPLELGHSMPWLSGRGHFNELAASKAPDSVIGALAEIHRTLGGNSEVLATRRPANPPTPDLIHAELGCLIEVDEVQHFTSARLVTLDFYPEEVPLGFQLDEYRQLIEAWKVKGDRAYAHKVSADFPQQGGRQKQRAYNDALRDLLTPTFTGFPLIRLPVPGRSFDGVLEQLTQILNRLA